MAGVLKVKVGGVWVDVNTAGPQGPQGPTGPAGPSGGGSTPGGADTQVQFNDAGVLAGDAGLFYNKATDVLMVVGAVGIGTNPATTGAIRLANAAPIYARNAANTADLALIQPFSDNVIYVGSNAGDAGLILRSAVAIGVQGTVYPTTDGNRDLGQPAGTRFRDAYLSSSVRIGTNPAQSGAIRLANGSGIYFRNAANAADVAAIYFDGNNALLLSGAYVLTQARILSSPDATNDLGSTGLRFRDAFLSGAVSIGTNPASAGAIRLANYGQIAWRNAANTADVVAILVDTGNNLRLGNATMPTVAPSNDAVINLGASNVRWKDGHFSGAVNAPAHTFPSTAVPSADPNTLDDYREGTFTPFIASDGGYSGQTYSTQSGHYVKTGRQVVVNGSVALTWRGTFTGFLQIGGLPFPCSYGCDAVIGLVTGLNTAVSGLHLQFPAGSTVGYLRAFPAGGGTGMTGVTTSLLSDTVTITFSAAYVATN